MDVRTLLVPFLHRFMPLPGPGGIASIVLSRALEADASNMVHVFRFLDVVEVWQRDADFSVRGYDERMTATTGPFILGMNEPERYGPEAKILYGAVRREDGQLVRKIVREETQAAIDRVLGVGRIDAIQDLAEIVCIRLAQRYYGLEGPDPKELLWLFQVASWYIFSFWSDPGMRDAAVPAGEQLRKILTDLIAERRKSGNLGDDVLGRLLSAGGFSDGDAGVARSIAGIASGTLNAPIGLFANSVDKLLDLPEDDQARVRELARGARDGSEEDRAVLAAHVDEAERFGVFPSVLYRRAERDAVVAAGTTRERTIPKGCQVVVWPSLGAFDRDVFEAPFEFRPGRPAWKYMSFGFGRHRCLGEHIGQVLVHEMTEALFALPRLRRAPGKAGRIAHRKVQQSNFPSSLTLEFDRAS